MAKSRRHLKVGCTAKEVKIQLHFNLNDVNFVVVLLVFGNGVKSPGAIVNCRFSWALWFKADCKLQEKT